jgi:hypothetical protein
VTNFFVFSFDRLINSAYNPLHNRRCALVKSDELLGAGCPKTTYLLQRNISAIQIIPDAHGRMRLGTIVQLPEGAQVEVCGEGFDERTTKVCCRGGFYYIFLEDIEADMLRATAWAAG